MSARLWTEEQFNCPVCLDLPSDPVTIPCGHSYCKACIADYWENEGRKNGTYSCPECRQTFNPRPTLCRNTMLAEAVEQLRRGALSSTGRESIKSARSAASSASERAHTRSKGASKKLPGSAVPCDRCPEPRAAVKTCLVCMASFCEIHLKPHNTQEKLKNHELISPTGDLSQKICPEHKYLQEFFCRSCQMYVCWLCTSNQHKGHESVSTQAERNEKQSLCCPLEGGELGAVTVNPEATFDPVRSVVVQLREKVEEMCDQELDKKLTLRVFRPQSPESETSSCNVSSFLTHLVFSFCFLFSHLFVSLSLLDACDLTLDPNTAHRRLVLSDGDTVATLQQTSQPFPDLPQRFDGWTQVLCLQPLSSDRCYWEVEWRGCGSSLGVVSGSMSRKGADTGAGLGYNSQSWSLELSDMCCAAMHANKKVEIPVTYSPRVGVFLDRTAGTLTFYSVDDELVPLHAFQGSFPPPLYAAFGVGCGVGVGLDFAMGQLSSTTARFVNLQKSNILVIVIRMIMLQYIKQSCGFNSEDMFNFLCKM
uniref:Tripartite motif containing 25, like n=1 Tax=Sinocyclocheilus anshuiensis TaxID=1608454 RepID=A0A671NF17_9TELE